MQNEKDILEKYIAGDSLAFGQIYDFYFPKLYNFVFYKVNSQLDAEEIVSQTFYDIVKNICKYNSEKGQFNTWIYTIARNNVVDFYRKKYEVSDIEDYYDISSGEDVERSVHASLELGKVREYLKTLKSAQREIVILRVWEGLSFREVGEVVGKNEAAVKTAFARIVKRMGEEIIFLYFISLIIK